MAFSRPACGRRTFGRTDASVGNHGTPPMKSTANRLRNCWSRVLVITLLCLGACARVFSQALPLETRPDSVRYNLSSTNGLPLSSVRGAPPGSDGRAPTLAQQQAAGLTEVPATTNQFSGLTTFGALV